MKRRLEIARGLLHSPRVLFLDEPTVGLDPHTRAHIWTYIEELRRREQITIFLTTHYMEEAEHCNWRSSRSSAPPPSASRFSSSGSPSRRGASVTLPHPYDPPTGLTAALDQGIDPPRAALGP
jgi:hypothetical protein